MRKKLVMSMMMIVTMAAFLTGSAFASFMDAESSSDNSFQAGTLDLKTDNTDGVTQTLYATDLKPGESMGEATIVLRNIGSIDGASLDIDVSYVNDDGTQPSKYPGTVTADEFAAVLEITKMELDEDNSLLASVSDWNSNSYKDIQDLLHAGLTDTDGIDSGQTRDFIIEVTLRGDLNNNDFQADGIDMDFTFTLSP